MYIFSKKEQVGQTCWLSYHSRFADKRSSKDKSKRLSFAQPNHAPSRSSNNDSQQRWVARRHNSALINVTVGVHVIIRESVTFPVNFLLVNKSTVPIDRACLIVAVSLQAGLEVSSVHEERSAVKCSAQARHYGAVNTIVSLKDAEWPAVAAEDVGGAGLRIGAVVAVANEDVIRDLALDVACGRLRVDSESLGRVAAPDLVDVARVVSPENAWIA